MTDQEFEALQYLTTYSPDSYKAIPFDERLEDARVLVLLLRQHDSKTKFSTLMLYLTEYSEMIRYVSDDNLKEFLSSLKMRRVNSVN